ncbi:hypothetical protein R69927_05647 [Paraburkholderia domus]|jgi:hypothetical protein|uniref:hypothetical protein n=1 Tax=Paraburkholderia domus TaxID=2793075 RepID=UPI001912D96A|nr:hypothetical protein [Paraburkholderia domus]MBK5050798.1 hypothetical protein [Burkholderia sp. R-70006]MBK5089877.1 hypothetical protein [Burkholderia sp. R-69927]CAE6766006.1 hypothetical protein R70006_03723 [Paraburkholderia domus]CAE6905478.1 hypothetical protein R69927_05647 [Paraburkholderia domus]
MNKLQQIFAFLKHNHQWNDAFQLREYKRYLSHCRTPKERIIALLHMVAHTQSSPKLEALAGFWEHLEAAPWKSDAPSLVELTDFIQQKGLLIILNHGPWDRLFRALSSVSGWGPKTAALFVKCVIQLHRSAHIELHFLADAHSAGHINESDRIYLPVDAVIKRISLEAASLGLGQSFDSMNSALFTAGFTPDDMLIWDDLWFWGFFSQNSSRTARTVGWNEARFWGQLSTPKDDVDAVRKKSAKFLALLSA